MNDNRKLIVRKAKDGINYEAVIRDYCGHWYDRKTCTGSTPHDAINGLITDISNEISWLESDLYLTMHGAWKYENENEKGE